MDPMPAEGVRLGIRVSTWRPGMTQETIQIITARIVAHPPTDNGFLQPDPRPMAPSTAGLVLVLSHVAGLLLATPAPAQEPTPAVRTVDQDSTWLERADAARTYLSDTTTVRIDEFTDFACPSCRAFFVLRADSLREELVAPGRANLVVRAFPLPRLMRGFQAAEAALCAGALMDRRGFQGMRHRLYMNQDVWRRLLDPTPVFLRFAQELGIPLQEFQECLLRDAMAPLILSDMNLAQLLGVTGTPTFVFNRGSGIDGSVKLSGDASIARFEEMISQVPAAEAR